MSKQVTKKKSKPRAPDAAVAIARAWLAKEGFHEDPDNDDPGRVEVRDAGYDVGTGEYYVNVRLYVPQLDIEHVIDGDHPDGIAVRNAS